MNILKALCFGIGIISSNVFSAKPGDVIEVGKYVFRTDLIEKTLNNVGQQGQVLSPCEKSYARL